MKREMVKNAPDPVSFFRNLEKHSRGWNDEHINKEFRDSRTQGLRNSGTQGIKNWNFKESKREELVRLKAGDFIFMALGALFVWLPSLLIHL
jgi:hypothetical protein